MKTKVKVKFFGALRQYADECIIEVPSEATARVLKSEISKKLAADFPTFKDGLIESCVVGVESQILQDSEELSAFENVALLPPVCGG